MVLQKLKVCSAVSNLARSGFIVPLVLVGSVALLAWTQDDDRPVSAFATLIPDIDEDGIRDEFEPSMFTDMNTWDSDGDSWSDAEEFAMRSNPGHGLRFPVSIPRLSTNLVARGEGGRLHVMCAAYFADATNQAGAQFELGVLIGRRYRSFSSDYLAINGESHSVAARPQGSKVAFFEISFPDQVIAHGTRLTLLAMIRKPGASSASAVARLDVIRDPSSGVLLMEYPTYMMPNPPGQAHPLPAGTVYLPIPSTIEPNNGGIPVSWAPSMLCYKEITTVGKMGAILIQQVSDAECVPGFEGFCSTPACVNTIGDQFQTVDPFSLVGSQ